MRTKCVTANRNGNDNGGRAMDGGNVDRRWRSEESGQGPKGTRRTGSFSRPLRASATMDDEAERHFREAPPDEGDCSSLDEDVDRTTSADARPSGPPPSSERAAAKAASALLISASDKAGMAGVDRERVNAILLRASGDSAFMRRQRQMDDKANGRMEEMKRRIERKGAEDDAGDWRRELERSAIEPVLRRYRRRRNPASTCVVVDMDGFFISCHVLDHPHLARVPACVGGTSMISTSNYIARKYGVRAAMPGYLGKRLVDELSGGKESLTFVKSDFALYKKKSAEVQAVLEEYDPNLKMYSLDEAYMDIGPYLEIRLRDQHREMTHEDIRKLLVDKINASTESQTSTETRKIHEILPLPVIHDAAESLLNTIRQKVKSTTGLTCSAGLCNNFLLAKVASDVNKPDGQHFVGPSEQQILEFVHPLPTRKISGIGRVMEKTLRGVCGIETVKDLYDKRAEVSFLFKPATSEFLMRASIGYSESKRNCSVDEESAEAEEALQRKGISHERTFSPTGDWTAMCMKLERITHCLAQDLRERSLRPKTITLKVKLANFHILTRAATRDVALFQNCNDRQSSRDLVDIVINLLKEAKRQHLSDATKSEVPFSVRLLGVRCSNFDTKKESQLSLDQYRIMGHASEFSSSPVPPQKDGGSFDSERSRMKNPYISPKATQTLRENSPKRTESRRSLYKTVSPSDVKLDSVQEVALDAQIQCPLCHKCFQTRKHDNAMINSHIDACLNASTVKELVKEESLCAKEEARKKRRRLEDFFK
ncbi:hypothetical protein ACHAWF_015638 [Thalassiosira exigua]